MPDDPLTHSLFTAFLRLHILCEAAKKPICGVEIASRLKRHGFQISSGTLYPTLRLLENLGYLSRQVGIVEGRQRKYYQATEVGKRVLEGARYRLQELTAAVLDVRDRFN